MLMNKNKKRFWNLAVVLVSFGTSALAAAQPQPVVCRLLAQDLSGKYVNVEETGGKADVSLSRVSASADSVVYRAEIVNHVYANTPEGSVIFRIVRGGDASDPCELKVETLDGQGLSWGTQLAHEPGQFESASIMGPGFGGSLTIEVTGFTCGGEDPHACLAVSTLYRK
jgi:hypothetical protein